MFSSPLPAGERDRVRGRVSQIIQHTAKAARLIVDLSWTAEGT